MASLIHPTALISPGVKLGANVTVGAYSIIRGAVSIGDGSSIGNFCVIEGNTTIGKECQFFTGAVVGSIPQDLKYKDEKSFLIIGDQNIFREYVTLNPGTTEGSKTTVGSNNLIMAYSHVAHNCTVGSGCVFANNATLAGHVTVEDKAVIGGLVAVHQFVHIGTLSIIGGCSKVVQDIPPYSMCDGHPARFYGLNSVGLKRAHFSPDSIRDIKHAVKILFHSSLTLSHALAEIEEKIPPSPEIKHLVDFARSSERGMCK